jgi:ATP-dependent DNA helicase RecQ
LSFFRQSFNTLTISLIAIDEAHCIIVRGMTLTYLYNLGYLKTGFPPTSILALDCHG